MGGGGPGASGECRKSEDGEKDNDRYELSVLLALCSQEVPEVFTPSLSYENPNLSTRASKVMQKGACKDGNSRYRYGLTFLYPSVLMTVLTSLQREITECLSGD